MTRPRDIADGPTPAGQSVAAEALLAFAAYSGSSPHREAAEQAVASALAIAPHAPRAAGWGLAVAEAIAPVRSRSRWSATPTTRSLKRCGAS